MTNHTPTPGNAPGLPVRPVNTWDNDYYHRLPLTADGVFREFMNDVTELRARQKAYLDSLPADPIEAARKAKEILHPDGEDYPEGFEKALHLSWALEALLKGRDLDASGRERDAALWIAREVTSALSAAAVRLEHVSDLLCKGPRDPIPDAPQE